MVRSAAIDEASMARKDGRRSSGRPARAHPASLPEPRALMLSSKENPFLPFGLFASIVLLICCLFTQAWAQSPADVEDVHIKPRVTEKPKTDDVLTASVKTGTPFIKKDVNIVLVPVTITDPMNRLVTGLDKENFQVFEGKDSQEIKHFSSEDAPISLGVIFDMSGSMNSKIERAREAVGEFFKTANPEDEFFMIAFADKPEQISDFTNSVEDIQGKLIYTVPKGRTALLDAIYLGVSKMRQAKYPKKALLI